jgi:hypothetical protein
MAGAYPSMYQPRQTQQKYDTSFSHSFSDYRAHSFKSRNWNGDVITLGHDG